jgi:4a-hydroxytetrahydrobiopterin dehydratase
MAELAQMHCTPVKAGSPRLNAREIAGLMPGLPGWKTSGSKGVLRLEKSYQFKDFSQALAFTDRVGQLAEQEDHHPAILTEWGKVTITWWTHKIKGLHMNDFIMAARTEGLFLAGFSESPA